MPDAGKPTPAPHAPPGAPVVRVLIADDSAFMRRALSRAVSEGAGLEVVGTARDGADAVEKAKALRPDVVTLDIEMPVLDGHATISRILRECSDGGGPASPGAPAIIVFSSLTTARSHDALQALREGASDVVSKDTPVEDLLHRIRAIALARSRRASGASIGQAAFRPIGPSAMPALRSLRLAVIGSSTGGPPVLERILGALPGGLGYSIVIAQHLPAAFTGAMAERLDRVCAFPVLHGENGLAIRPGAAYLIPGGRHGRIRMLGQQARMEISDEPRELSLRPSVDELFTSAAQFGSQAAGVVLTGLGDDGRKGGAAILGAGGALLAQDQESSVVYGMPRVAAEIGGTPLSPDAICAILARARAPEAKAA